VVVVYTEGTLVARLPVVALVLFAVPLAAEVEGAAVVAGGDAVVLLTGGASVVGEGGDGVAGL
jgi:hypothetical protein